MQRTAARQARYFAIGCRPRWGFNSNDFVLRRAIGTLEKLRIRHTPKIAIRGVKCSAKWMGQS